jgi:FlaA1/EpsC-like NDP-sugar epimerase
MVALLSIGGFRFLSSWVINRVRSSDGDNQFTTKLRVLIFGAGEAGRQLAVGLCQRREYQLYGFVDDKKELHGRDMMGVPILPVDDLTPFLSLHKITDLFLAIPSISRKKRNIILERLHSLPVRVRTLPGLVDLAQGRVNLSDLQELEIDDILLRDVAKPDEDLLKAQVSDQIVLVTGAGGSIGSEICRQVLKRHPKILLLLELSEYALYTIQQELQVFVTKLDKRDGDNLLLPNYAQPWVRVYTQQRDRLPLASRAASI